MRREQQITETREAPIPGVTAQCVVDAASSFGHRQAHFLDDRRQVLPTLSRILKPGDLLLTMGAGDVYRFGEDFLKEGAR